MIYILCGVSGTGKSTIGARLANELSLPFYDGDDFHPTANIEKMRRGIPLNDADRQPWLETLASLLPQWAEQGGAVLACSALKESYRQTLSSQYQEYIYWVILTGTEELLRSRLDARKGHFFDPMLLRSQLDTLELPNYGRIVDVTPSPDKILESLMSPAEYEPPNPNI